MLLLFHDFHFVLISTVIVQIQNMKSRPEIVCPLNYKYDEYTKSMNNIMVGKCKVSVFKGERLYVRLAIYCYGKSINAYSSIKKVCTLKLNVFKTLLLLLPIKFLLQHTYYVILILIYHVPRGNKLEKKSIFYYSAYYNIMYYNNIPVVEQLQLWGGEIIIV